MKFIRGKQTDKIDDGAMTKTRVVCDGFAERIWVRQFQDHVVLVNSSFHLMPYNTWGWVLPSRDPAGLLAEEIDITEIRGEHPDDTVLEMHPEAWDQHLEANIIDEEGNYLEPTEEEAAEGKASEASESAIVESSGPALKLVR